MFSNAAGTNHLPELAETCLTKVLPAVLTNFLKKYILERFEAIAKLETLEPVRDFNLMKYSEGVRVNHSAMENWPDVDVPKDFSSYANVMQLVNDQHYTMQFHQPQRFCDDFWRVMAALEEAFGALVGANIYWTPKSTQGLAPHWDSIDAFVLQVGCETKIVKKLKEFFYKKEISKISKISYLFSL